MPETARHVALPHKYERYPKCPYCDHEMNDLCDLDFHDEETTLVMCDKCERDYQVTMHVTYEFSSDEPQSD